MNGLSIGLPQTVNRFNKAMRIGFYILVFILPLLFTPWTNIIFDLPKVVFLTIMTYLLLLTWIIKQIYSNVLYVYRTKIDWFLVIFGILAAISCYLSSHFLTSFLGEYGRYEGLLTIVNYLLLFFLAVQVFDKSIYKTALAKSIVFSAGIVALYGWYQYFGKDIFAWPGGIDIFRSTSTFGNSVLLGGYLALVFPISIALFFQAKKGIEVTLFGATTAMIFACLVTTFSRGAWIASLISFFCFILIVARMLLKKKWKFVAILALLALVAIFIIWESPETGSTTTNILARAQLIEQIEGSTGSRIEIWKTALTMIEKRPLFGYGPDTFGLTFDRFMTLKYLRINGAAARADKAHNHFLQIASTLGIPALLTFIVILLVWFRSVYKVIGRVKISGERFLYAGFTAAIVGYLIYLLTGLSVVGSTPLFWIILAVVISGTNLANKRTVAPTPQLTLLLRILSLFVFFIFLGVVWSFVNQYRADYYFNRGNLSVKKKNFSKAYQCYRRAVNLNPFVEEYPSKLGSLYKHRAEDKKGKVLFLKAVSNFKKAQTLSPGTSDDYYNLADAYIFAGEEFGRNYYSKAIGELRSSLYFKPFSPIAYHLLGKVYLGQDRPKKALISNQKAVYLYPKFATGYYGIGQAYEELGNEKKAINAYEEALEIQPHWHEVEEAIKKLQPNYDKHKHHKH